MELTTSTATDASPAPAALSLAPPEVARSRRAETETTAARPLPEWPGPPAASTGSLALPALLLAALAVAALVLARRKRAAAPSRLVEVVESVGLGPRRSLVVARVADELLVLGASEAGIALLATRPAPPESLPAPVSALPRAPESTQGAALRGLLGRISPRRRREEAAFDAALAESLEDLELRRKLGGGQPGIVP